jgi:hypothetical protein
MVGKKAGTKGPSAAQSRRRAARAKGSRRDDRSDYKNVRRAEKIEANKKSGCLPKLGMFILPFIAVGVYFILS